MMQGLLIYTYRLAQWEFEIRNSFSEVFHNHLFHYFLTGVKSDQWAAVGGLRVVELPGRNSLDVTPGDMEKQAAGWWW